MFNRSSWEQLILAFSAIHRLSFTYCENNHNKLLPALLQRKHNSSAAAWMRCSYFLTISLALKGNLEQLLCGFIIKRKWLDMLTWWMSEISALKTEWHSCRACAASFSSSALARLKPFQGNYFNKNTFLLTEYFQLIANESSRVNWMFNSIHLFSNKNFKVIFYEQQWILVIDWPISLLCWQEQAQCRDSRSTISGRGGVGAYDYLGRPVLHNNSRRGRDRLLDRDEESRLRVESYVRNSNMSLVSIYRGKSRPDFSK